MPESMGPWVFRARLTRPPGVGTWTFAMVPASVASVAALKPHMRVLGAIDGKPFRSSLMPRGQGRLFVVVPKPVRERIGKRPGESVELSLGLDRHRVVVRLPSDFRTALGPVRERFDRLAPSHRKAYVQWIASAKQDSTRARRIRKAVGMIRSGLTLN